MPLKKYKAHYVSFGAVLAVVFPFSAVAFDFEPTEAEFLAWPKYCQVAYVRTTVGRRSPFGSRITPSDVASAKSVLGDSQFGEVGVHHYCASLWFLARARVQRDQRRRNAELRRARDELEYSLGMARPDHRMYPAFAVQMAAILYEQDDLIEASQWLDKAVAAAPANPAAYVAKATIYSDQGEYERARQVLAEGDAQVGGASPDIHYNLGLALLKLGEPERAAEYAYKAYGAGYPLAGLRQQLQRLGHWNPPR